MTPQRIELHTTPHMLSLVAVPVVVVVLLLAVEVVVVVVVPVLVVVVWVGVALARTSLLPPGVLMSRETVTSSTCSVPYTPTMNR